ncbi:methyl-accepting chemotaxis protein [Neptuniibacter sp. QD48_55]|uniref:methyl-accepting chemotaxis protein n=1 Tax=Neptuniibacter sp. QD48_55 TaxID=3398212 RepID=UPI0039F4A305
MKSKGEGFVEYTYKGPQFKKPKEKVSYVKGLKEWDWVVGSGIYLSDVQEIFFAIFAESLTLLFLVLSFAFFGCWFIVRDITQPINKMLAAVRKIASGDLTHPVSFNRQDEVGQLGDELTNMTSSLRQLLGNVNDVVFSLSHRASEMRSNTMLTREGMDRQFNEVNQLAAAMEEMSATIQEVAQNAQTTSGATQQATQETESSQTDVNRSVHEISKLSDNVAAANTVMNELNHHTSKIGEVVSVIREISEQTNLLALNAAIEAARAGEAGRGFAVVADEVRSLASRTQSSTGEIEEIIEQLQNKSASANDQMQLSQQKAQENASLVQQTGNNISSIVEHISCVNDISNQIATAAEEQSYVAAEISNSLTGIRDISEHVVQHAHQISSNSEQVNSMAEDLNVKISRFKLS